jgi:large subunit ribosomal protein L23
MSSNVQIIKKLQMTEKGTQLSGSQNKYFFVVDPSANKIEIRRAVEASFGVKVKSVNTSLYLGKNRRERTKSSGKCNDWKRAIVTLHPGSKIDLI